MNCTSCGTEIETGSRFCDNCGSAVRSPAEHAAGTPSPGPQPAAPRSSAAPPAAAAPAPIVLPAHGKISAATFGLVLVCFLMPFVSVSCQQQKFVTLTGLQMVTGTTLRQPQMFGPPKTQKVAPEPLAILAFLAALGGLFVAILIGQKQPLIPAIFAGAGVILLFGLKSKLDSEVAHQSQGLFHLNYEAGFWLALLLCLGLASLNLFVHIRAAHTGVSKASPQHPVAAISHRKSE